MSLLQDLKYPFGNPLDRISHLDQIALRNVLNLAKERVWMAHGRPIPTKDDLGYPVYSDDLGGMELLAAETSIEHVDKVIRYIQEETRASKKENT